MGEWIFVMMIMWNGRFTPGGHIEIPTSELNCFKAVAAAHSKFPHSDQNRHGFFTACLPPEGVDHIPEALLEDSDNPPDV